MIRPTPGQLAWQEAGFGLFLHFGVNTFHGMEWSDGTLDPAMFDPRDLDAAQWVQTAVDAGAQYAVFTAKHHDGFCLWPTATTAYSVKSAAWRGGKGDVVGELAAACEAAGLKLGLYLSPWDRNAACYADPAAYDDFYVRQLTELCTNYGPLFEIWFDGAGSEGRTYDWDAIMAVVDRHQPGAMVFNMGRPTIRWVGNEDGLAADPCDYVVDRVLGSVYAELPVPIEPSPRCASSRTDRDGDEPLREPRYLPPECDVPIRANWFWQPDDEHTRKSRDHLLDIWYRSVGLGAGLLLNVPPDRRGLIDDGDRARLLEFAGEVGRRLARPVHGELSISDGELVVRFPRPVRFDHLELREDLQAGQRVTSHEVRAHGEVIASGHTMGVRRVHALAPVEATELRIRVGGADPVVRAVTAYEV